MEDKEKEALTSKQTKKQLFWEIVRFVIVGGTVTLVDYLCFYLVRVWILPESLFSSKTWDVFSLAIATAVGFCVGLCISWKLSIAFIFRSVKDKEKASSPKAFFLFAFIGVMGLVLTELGMLIMVHTLPAILLFGRTKCLDLPWAEWLAKIVMTFIVMVFNYLGRKLFIFKS